MNAQSRARRIGRSTRRVAATCRFVVVCVALASCSDDGARSNAVATFEVAGGEEFRVELATPALVEHAVDLLNGGDLAAIPIGTIVRDDAGVNEPWSWHIDPATFEFASVTVEVCDGLPSYVEDGTLTSAQFCPWSAKVIDVSGN